MFPLSSVHFLVLSFNPKWLAVTHAAAPNAYMLVGLKQSARRSKADERAALIDGLAEGVIAETASSSLVASRAVSADVWDDASGPAALKRHGFCRPGFREHSGGGTRPRLSTRI